MPPKPRQPDLTDDPRKTGVGQQLPEEQQEDAIPEDGGTGAPKQVSPKKTTRRNTGQDDDRKAGTTREV